MSPAFREWGRRRGGAAAEGKIPSAPPLGTDSRPRPGNGGGAWGLQAAPRPPPVPAPQVGEAASKPENSKEDND